MKTNSVKRLVGFFIISFLAAGVLGAASITVTMPYTGLTYHITLAMPIAWTSSGSVPGQVRIQLRNAASTAVVKDIVNPTQNDGHYVWDIPASVTPGQYRIRVKAIGANVFGDSQVFNINLNPHWTPIHPGTDESWARGLTHQITWTNFGPVPAKLNINLVQGQTKTLIATCVPDTGSYSWAIPLNQATGQYQIELDGKTASCQSAGFFCSGPIFNITMPLFPHVKVEKK